MFLILCILWNDPFWFLHFDKCHFNLDFQASSCALLRYRVLHIPLWVKAIPSLSWMNWRGSAMEQRTLRYQLWQSYCYFQLKIKKSYLTPSPFFVCAAWGHCFLTLLYYYTILLLTIFTILLLYILQVSAALASNIQTVTPQTFASLGSASSGLTSSQITSVGPSVLVSSLATLSTISTWNPEQSSAIIQTMITSGFQVNALLSM